MSSLYSMPTSVAGSDARTNVIYALGRLKEKFPERISWNELVAYVLPIHRRTEEQITYFRTFLSKNPKVDYDEEADTYRYRPEHNIASADDLLRYLQNQESAMGINVRELKDTWPDVEYAIDKLEAEHKLLVVRNKKDNHPRTVWVDDPTLNVSLDNEFKDIWSQIPLPSVEDTIRELRRMNHKSTGEPAQLDAAAKPKEKKKKTRRGQKVTNTHMQGLFRDYSEKRPQGR
ncbi:transcription factor TFIIE beta subunit, TFIIEB, Tfa2 [Vermiconidia calcicola]|uniref:Transcription factor TFIIE beta subunit, TFIIEB, Tfa2 n=1 Tax=Vermiconidia calcicola TaxID=1690605 RepID=A0AAV9Q980_9PEZI|nr:transcription factor TFIIE beta subunit, TFIIEB, Tfa2 [Vermiconidia calcicola]